LIRGVGYSVVGCSEKSQVFEGQDVGAEDGDEEGSDDGLWLRDPLGSDEGLDDGDEEGCDDALPIGDPLGADEGGEEGDDTGRDEGALKGVKDCRYDGARLGGEGTEGGSIGRVGR
jgi:hypothetical protein